MRKIEEFELKNTTALVASNLDVPLESGEITDNSRLKSNLETYHYILEQGGKIVILGYIGRPKGKVVPQLSNKILQNELQQLTGKEIGWAENCEQIQDSLTNHDIVLLENLRFWPEMEEPSEELAELLAKSGDVFVNDCYIAAHRHSATNDFLPKHLPSCLGFNFRKEYETISNAIDNAKKPLVLIIGGAKADKIGVINNLLGVAEHVLVGGILANTFLKSQGVDIKGSKFDERSLEIAGEFMREQEEKFVLPVDVVAASEFSENAESKECLLEEIPKGWLILDIGNKTAEKYSEIIAQAGTVIWGGPIGVFEWEKFMHGTQKIANALAKSECFSLVGGGDSGAAVKKLGLEEQMSHVSIGGGATLTLIGGGELPAITAIQDAQ